MGYADESVWGADIFLHHCPPDQSGVLRRAIADRRQYLEAGIAKAMFEAPDVNQLLQAYDPLLQLRWDFDNDCWCVDRRIDPEGFYAIIVLWKDQFGPRILGNGSELLNLLRQSDIQRNFSSPTEYVNQKRKEAETIRDRKVAEGNEQMLEAVDSLSTKRMQQFVDVSRALSTGETITAHGADEDTLERLHAQTEQIKSQEHEQRIQEKRK